MYMIVQRKWCVTEIIILTFDSHPQCNMCTDKTNMDHIFQVQFYITSGSLCSFIADGNLLLPTMWYDDMLISVFYANWYSIN